MAGTRPLRKLDIIAPEEMRKYHVLSEDTLHITQVVTTQGGHVLSSGQVCGVSNVSCNDLNNELIRWLTRAPTSPSLLTSFIHFVRPILSPSHSGMPILKTDKFCSLSRSTERVLMHILSDMLGHYIMRCHRAPMSGRVTRDSHDDTVTAARVVTNNIVTLKDWSRWS